jgi:hypothetical protein
VKTITIQASDDRYTLRETLRRIDDDRVLVTLPWDIDRGWMQPLDYEVQYRVARHRPWEIAWVVEDPARRTLAKRAGFPVFGSEQAAQTHLAREGRFPALRNGTAPERPKTPWWAPEPQRPKKPTVRRPPVWVMALEGIALTIVIGIVAAALLLAVPSATITIEPQSLSFSRIVAVSVDPDLNTVDFQRSAIPAIRIGDEFEGYAEVITSGRGYAFSGRASGRVLFTNLLGQDYPVPAGTIVRTSAGSYPVRFETTQGVTVPSFGQAEAPVQALVEGPRGNVDAYQINLIEGVVGFAMRTTNPEPITGAQSETVRTVSQTDRDRAWDLAAQQVMAQAYNGLQDLASAVPGRFFPRQSLAVQASPKVAYTHLVGERTDVLGLALRLLVTGHAVQMRDTQAIAYHQLATQLPAGYTLTDARFAIGEAAEEDIGLGRFTFYVTAYGYGSANIDPETVQELVQGALIEEAQAALQSSLPLSKPAEIEVSPSWFPYVPFLPIRTQIDIVPGQITP